MDLSSLGYLGIAARNVSEWEDYATRLLGIERADHGGGATAFRIDDHRQRIFVDSSFGPGQHCFGWQAHDGAALSALAARLEQHHVAVKQEPASLAERRGVRELVSFHDPALNRIEVFHSPVAADTPFKPSRALSGFRTGALGLGHIVLTVSNMAAMRRFYQDLLGFRLSDYMAHPFGACFFHINARHHSLALIETGVDGVHHLMLELQAFDDVGQTYDLINADPALVGVTLGRHTNDLMTSFYARTPSDFMIEYGWGGLEIDVDHWQPKELLDGPSLWGHDRFWLPPDKRAEARDMRVRAAARGAKAPVQVAAGNYRLKQG